MKASDVLSAGRSSHPSGRSNDGPPRPCHLYRWAGRRCVVSDVPGPWRRDEPLTRTHSAYWRQAAPLNHRHTAREIPATAGERVRAAAWIHAAGAGWQPRPAPGATALPWIRPGSQETRRWRPQSPRGCLPARSACRARSPRVGWANAGRTRVARPPGWNPVRR